MRKCLHCGLETRLEFTEFRDRHVSCTCLKCDDELLEQSDGSIITRDIAHQQETVQQALVKMDDVLQQAWEGYARGIRLVVGGGRIREEVLSQCQYYLDQDYIESYSVDHSNYGAILVFLRSVEDLRSFSLLPLLVIAEALQIRSVDLPGHPPGCRLPHSPSPTGCA